jgi:Winged helix DNA-binding domain
MYRLYRTYVRLWQTLGVNPTGARRTIDAGERRARLATRHLLVPSERADDVVDVVRGIVALHATDPASVYLSARARLNAPTVAAVEHALYEDRSLVRLLGMRRTMFVVPVGLAPIVQSACTEAIAVVERRKLVGHIEQGGVAEDGEAWLARVGDATVAALEKRGDALATELSADVPDLATEMKVGEGTKWAVTQKLSNRVLSVLAAEERIVRGRPRGTWTSTQYRWAPRSAWLPDAEPAPPVETARADLARQWLAAFGPGTAADLKWWTGWTMGAARSALAAVGAVEVALDGAVGYLLADDVDPVTAPAPAAALLPALDPTAMGWTQREWYLGAHRGALFDRSGNIGPTVWWDGRIVGGWAQRREGDVVTRLLEDVGGEASAAVSAAAQGLTEWLGTARIRSRFPTPLERELVGT